MIYLQEMPLSASTLKAVINGRPEVAGILIKDLIQAGILEKLILDYDYGKGKIDNVGVQGNTLTFNSALKGKFRATYQISEYSICAAIDYTDSEHMDIHFEIDKETGSISLSGENRIERIDEI